MNMEQRMAAVAPRLRGWSGARAGAWLLAIGGLLLWATHWLPERLARCGADQQPMLQAQIFFGRNIGTQPGISETNFRRFVAEELTPRFPDGLTLSDAVGQWRSPHDEVIHEQATILTLILADDSKARAALEAARRAYVVRFHQQSALMVTQSVCVRA